MTLPLIQFTDAIESAGDRWDQCPWMVHIDHPRFRGDHFCELPEGHEGGHRDGDLGWHGGEKR